MSEINPNIAHISCNLCGKQWQVLNEEGTELRGRFTAAGRTDAFREVNESIDVDSIVNKIINELKQ